MQRKLGALGAAVLMAASAQARAAELIRPAELPPDPTVRKAWFDALAQEPYAAAWQPEWTHGVPKKQVQEALASSLATLRAAQAQDNLELWLAIGLTARWAYNVDLEEAVEVGVAALQHAVARAGADPRPEWFLGANLCATQRELPKAMPHFLAAQARTATAALPDAFWHDALFCAHVSGMIAHAVQAGRELERRGRVDPGERKIIEHDLELLRDPDPAVEIPTQEAWSVTGSGQDDRIASLTCGFSFLRRPGWAPAAPKRGGCAATGPLGPFPGKEGDVTPSILVLARVARPGESLQGFAGSFPFLAKSAAVEGYACPASACRALEAQHPEDYVSEGGGVVTAVFFERDEPALRGLALETPRRLDAPADGAVHYFRPTPQYVRYRGKIFYLVLLDSARSVADGARGEFRRFMSELRVE